MPTFRDLLAQAKASIREVDTAGAEAALTVNPATVVLDVREADEYEQGALPNAVHIPRGHLESQVESRLGTGGVDLTDGRLGLGQQVTEGRHVSILGRESGSDH